MTNKNITFEQMVESAVSQVIRAFGKGEDLHGACWAICNGTANWAIDQEKAKVEASKTIRRKQRKKSVARQVK